MSQPSLSLHTLERSALSAEGTAERSTIAVPPSRGGDRLVLLPREHGAWGMLLQPFLGALIVLHRANWAAIPAFAVLVFVLREPLMVLARQRWTWRTRHVETEHAKRFVAVECFLLALCGATLLRVLPWPVIATLAGGAAALTAVSVFVTLHNRQREIWFQALSSTGLSSSVIVACLAITGGVPAWGWWWWGLHAAHFLGGILTVHVQLDARALARRAQKLVSGSFGTLGRDAVRFQAAFASVAVVLAVLGKPFYATAVILSAVYHLWNLRLAQSLRGWDLPMKTVGKRALAVSIAFTLLTGAQVF